MMRHDALARAERDCDAHIAEALRRYEQSLIDHEAPAEARDDMRAWARDYLLAWKARRLWDLRAQLFLERWRGGTVQ